MSGRLVADIELAGFYREQASRLARRALEVSDRRARLELMEMAATFQRLALREEGIAANCNIDAGAGNRREA